jgi:DNA-binding XRE family transcriptional regulator
MTEPASITAHWQRLANTSEPYRVPDLKGWEHSFRTGNMIAAARMLAGWTQAQLAEAAGLHERTVRKWEAEPTPWRKGYALSRMQQALATRGVIIFLRPTPGVRYDRSVGRVTG